MLISPIELSRIWGVKPKGILHVGAHEAEEFESYSSAGWSDLYPVIWVEAQPDLCEKLRNKLDPKKSRVICAVVWNISGLNLELNIASNSQSTSLLELGTHKDNYPDITYIDKISVVTSRLDGVLNSFDSFDFVNLDIQGVELQALQGMGELLNSVKWIYTECNIEDVYIGCTKLDDLDNFLSGFGYMRVHTRLSGNAGWGDCLYLKIPTGPLALLDLGKLKFKRAYFNFRESAGIRARISGLFQGKIR
jgi:FkbM family methyltransferase